MSRTRKGKIQSRISTFLSGHRKKYPRVRRPGDISKLVIPSTRREINRMGPNDLVKYASYGAWLLEEMSTADVVIKFCTHAKDRIEAEYRQENPKAPKWAIQSACRLEDAEYEHLCEFVVHWSAKKIKMESLYKAIEMTTSALRQVTIHRTSEANLTRKGYG